MILDTESRQRIDNIAVDFKILSKGIKYLLDNVQDKLAKDRLHYHLASAYTALNLLMAYESGIIEDSSTLPKVLDDCEAFMDKAMSEIRSHNDYPHP